jgi:hypothetical protein
VRSWLCVLEEAAIGEGRSLAGRGALSCAVLPLDCVYTAPFVLGLHFDRVVVAAGYEEEELFFFGPCAPQSLGIWDQAFAAFSGLVMVGYEFGSEILQVLRRKYAEWHVRTF